ncbi:zinc finger BED domain-containing protein RICESLEEPER 1-like [Malania oleifera]|uniref:zinc finger BED domain-containing protein RICESLEEPER 1-like n=1 Tax=Malania oleifera TaxID=397392 RepID=UPI0025AE85D4|nr:zinc finger BED domain-containing protein RICESLEEPER 1-like [Malania oleifera]
MGLAGPAAGRNLQYLNISSASRTQLGRPSLFPWSSTWSRPTFSPFSVFNFTPPPPSHLLLFVFLNPHSSVLHSDCVSSAVRASRLHLLLPHFSFSLLGSRLSPLASRMFEFGDNASLNTTPCPSSCPSPSPSPSMNTESVNNVATGTELGEKRKFKSRSENDSYMCLIVHFVDIEWRLLKRILSFGPVPNHRGEVLGFAIEKALLDWGIDKVFTITVDNASSNGTAISYLKRRVNNWKGSVLNGEFMHMRCVAHIINLIVQDGLKLVGDSVLRIRQAVKYIRQSPGRTAKFKECANEEKVNCKKHLCLDVPTRWNSIYMMLDTAQKFQKVFDRYDEKDQDFTLDLSKDGGKGKPMEDDWDNVRKMVQFLGCFYHFTLRVSGSNYVTSNTFFHEICMVKDVIFSMYDEYKNGGRQFQCSGPNGKTTEASSSSSSRITGMDYVVDDDEPTMKMMMVMLDKFKRHRSEKEGGEGKSDLERYLSEEPKEGSQEFDILGWWKINNPRFPILSQLARDVLAIPIATIAFESTFSTEGRFLDSFRTSLTPKIVEALICSQDWLRNSPLPVNYEESLEELDKLEKEFDPIGMDDLLE